MKENIQETSVALSLVGLLALPLCHAEQLPLWEIGAGIGALNLHAL